MLSAVAPHKEYFIRCSTWVSSGLTNKYKLRLRALPNEKHSSLFRQIVNDKKGFMTSTPGPNVIKLFTFVFNECSQKARVFDPGKLFKPSLMIVGKAKSLPQRGTSFRVSTWVGSSLSQKH
jgi:hypothetical protein